MEIETEIGMIEVKELKPFIVDKVKRHALKLGYSDQTPFLKAEGVRVVLKK